MSEVVFNKIKEFLDEKSIEYKVLTHEPVFTSEQAAKVRGADIKSGAKAMILRSKGKFFMFVLAGDKKIDMKKVKQVLGTKSISFASSEEVLKIADCEVGSVPPFGNLFDIPVYVDKSLARSEFINFNAGLHTHSVQMKYSDFIDVVNPVIEDFAA